MAKHPSKPIPEIITEKVSLYSGLEKMPVGKLLNSMNKEDQKVAVAVKKTIPSIEKFVKSALPKLKQGGRLIYLGAGTSGRLGIVDASECPPTFGIEQGRVIGIIAGGDKAIRKAVEFAEDNPRAGWNDLLKLNIHTNDVVVGIAASGSTPYVTGAIQQCNKNKILTGGITCNPGSPLANLAKFPIVAEVGPEFLTGSTRLKSGTAQKLILNMISTALMVGLGRVKGNQMVDMQLSNHKLIGRGTKMIMEALNIEEHAAKALLKKTGSVRKSLSLKALKDAGN